MNVIADRYRTLADAFEGKIAAVHGDEWESQSPCEKWSARDLVDHVVGVHGMMLGLIGRELTPVEATGDPLAAFRAARADMHAVLDDDDLAATEYDGYFGRTTIAETVDQFLGLDLVIHGWDLARATGQDTAIDTVEVERIWSQVQQLGDNVRSPEVCGPAIDIDEGAPLQDRLLAFLGRDPR